jgi:hypothetical protein
MDLAAQLRTDLASKFTRKKRRAAERAILDAVDEDKNTRTRRGKNLPRARYNNRYVKRYADREKGGRRSPVTLRNNTNSIEQTKVVSLGGNKGSELRFRNRRKGRIFKFHDAGINYSRKGNTKRQVYPDNVGQVPKAYDEAAYNNVFKILNGNS